LESIDDLQQLEVLVFSSDYMNILTV